MGRTRHTAEQIIGKLREAEVALAKGQTTGELAPKLGITEQIDNRWRKEYGGLRVDPAKRLKELEKENARLKRLVADPALDNAILNEVSSGKFQARSGGAAQWSLFVSGSVSPSVGLAECWDSRDRRSGIVCGAVTESFGWWLASLNLPKPTAATATGGLPLYCAEKAGV